MKIAHSQPPVFCKITLWRRPLSLTAALRLLLLLLLPTASFAQQINSGSDGHDGAFNPTSNVVIDMADHPDGIYHYTSVNIPVGVAVSFSPNANNKPVVWLVQGSCVIGGVVDVAGKASAGALAGLGGPGGWAGGSSGSNPGLGSGPGGGPAGTSEDGVYFGGNASHATKGNVSSQQKLSGTIYGNQFLLPLMGGSGGGGTSSWAYGGAGGGGAILIASAQAILINGSIIANGGNGPVTGSGIMGASGSGGSVRLVAPSVTGNGNVYASGGSSSGFQYSSVAGAGRVRFDTYQNQFGGNITGSFTQGFQPIILPAAGQGIQLAVTSVAGVAVAANPSGVLTAPDVVIPAQQNNPVTVAVTCTNVPLNSEISVIIHPSVGADVQAVGINSAGTAALSTATVSVNLPRGGGIIYARAVTGIGGSASASASSPASGSAGPQVASLAETGWTAEGERFVQLEITAPLGGPQQFAYITASGKRYPTQAQ